jgi:hypothetical protein
MTTTEGSTLAPHSNASTRVEIILDHVTDSPSDSAPASGEGRGAECDRLDSRIRRFGLLALLISAPGNLVAAFVAGTANLNNVDGHPNAGFFTPAQWVGVVSACFACLMGCAALVVPRRLPLTDRAVAARSWLNRLAILACCSLLLGLTAALVATGDQS